MSCANMCTGGHSDNSVDSPLDDETLQTPVVHLGRIHNNNKMIFYQNNLLLFKGCWADIKEELLMSNVLQRDNVILAKKLHPPLEATAKINDMNVR